MTTPNAGNTNAERQGDGMDDEYPDCDCGDDECPQCGKFCTECGGDGWGIIGDDFTNIDPLYFADGTITKCPNCHGSGLAKDMTYW
jgi:hypothetical protein